MKTKPRLSAILGAVVATIALLIGCGGGGGGGGGPQLSAPTGLLAAPGNGSVSLTWTVVSGATSYNVYRATSTGTLGTKTKIGFPTGGAYLDSAVTNGTTYYYQVTAVNDAGESGGSSEVSATPKAPPPPPAPTGVAASAGYSSATISWDAVSGAISYNIYWSTTAGVTPANGTKIAGATFPYLQTGLTNGITYYYVVTAVNANGESAPSSQVSATPSLATPTGVGARAGNGSVTISWTSASGAISYNLYWSTSAGVTPANGTKITGATSPYVQTGLTNGTTYYYVVTAVYASGESAPSSQVSATPNAVGQYTFFKLVHDPVRSVLYGLDSTQGLVVFISDSSLSPTLQISVGTNPSDISVDPTGSALYVGNSNVTGIVRISPVTGTFQTLSSPRIAFMVRAMASGTVASIDNPFPQYTSLTVQDGTSGAVLAGVGSFYQGAIDTTADGSSVFVGESAVEGGNIWRYALSGGTLVEVTNSFAYNNGFGFPYADRVVTALSDGSAVFYAGYLMNGTDLSQSIYTLADLILTTTPDKRLAISASTVYAVSSGAVLGSLPFTSSVQAVSPDSTTLYLAGSGSISKVNLTAF